MDADDNTTATNPIDGLQFGSGIEQAERASVIERLEGLRPHLQSFESGHADLEVWVRQRSTEDQMVFITLKAGGLDLVAQSDQSDFLSAVSDAGKDLRRQLRDAHSKRTDHRRR